MENGFEITYERSRRARSISISVKPGGKVLVRFPFFAAQKTAERFAEAKKEWIMKAVAKSKDKIALPKATDKHYRGHREEARRRISERLEHFNLHYGMKWQGVRIGRQKSRWGSCSKRGVLSFSYSLIFLPAELLDYVVIHELCHLKEFNHSQNFWNLVAESAPGWKKHRALLRKYRAQ